MSPRPVDPPFDGSAPCAMCPPEVRNLSACAHNVVVNYDSNVPRVPKKLASLRDAVALWERYEAPPHVAACSEVAELAAAAKVVDACETWGALGEAMPRLRAAVTAAKKISDAHFRSQMHSHGALCWRCGEAACEPDCDATTEGATP